MNRVFRNVLAGSTVVAVWGAGAMVAAMPPPDSSPASARTPTTVPIGWLGFCRDEPRECAQRGTITAPFRLTRKNLGILRRVNDWVNATIRPVADARQWGQEDRWNYPDNGAGDCEDYALLKRRMLLNEDFPLQSLLLTVVRNRAGEGHAVLMVRTDHGDFILDNLNSEILPWSETGYDFIKRQSELDPNAWLKLEKSPDEEKIVTHAIRRGDPSPGQPLHPAAPRAR